MVKFWVNCIDSHISVLLKNFIDDYVGGLCKTFMGFESLLSVACSQNVSCRYFNCMISMVCHCHREWSRRRMFDDLIRVVVHARRLHPASAVVPSSSRDDPDRCSGHHCSLKLFSKKRNRTHFNEICKERPEPTYQSPFGSVTLR